MSQIEESIAENYEALVGDPAQGLTFADIAKRAEEQNDAALAGWARERAAAKGKSVKPDSARADVPKETRSDK